MLPALREALADANGKMPTAALRPGIFLTDGAIGNERVFENDQRNRKDGPHLHGRYRFGPRTSFAMSRAAALAKGHLHP